MNLHNDDDEHDHDLAHDLRVIADQIVERRWALAWLAGAGGTSLIAGSAAAQFVRGGRGTSTQGGVIAVGSLSGHTGTTGATTRGSTSSPSSGITTTTTSLGCVADASETSGAYPADGTDTSLRATSNVLTTSGIVRTDTPVEFHQLQHHG